MMVRPGMISGHVEPHADEIVTYSTPGSFSLTPPIWATKLIVNDCYSSGAGAHSSIPRSAGGGCAWAFTSVDTAVVGGVTAVNIAVGAGAAANTDGNPSYVQVGGIYIAYASPGLTNGSPGTVLVGGGFSGGSGGTNTAQNNGGGGGGGPSGPGGNGTSSPSAPSIVGGAGGGGLAGSGGDGTDPNGDNYGGGGAYAGISSIGTGAQGYVRITWKA